MQFDAKVPHNVIFTGNNDVSDSAAVRPPLSDLLLACAHQVQAVSAGRSLSDSLPETPERLRAATQSITYHVMRHMGLARALRRELVPRTPPVPLLDALLVVALCLLNTAELARLAKEQERPVPADWPVYDVHTLVDQAVTAAASQRRLQGFKGLVNGVLRRFSRERDRLLQQVLSDPEARWNHPNWWIRRLRKAYPDHWKALLEASQIPAPMLLRVNIRRIQPAEFIALLSQAGIAAQRYAESGVVLDEPCAVQNIPGFAQGYFSVQDGGAQMAAALLQPENGQRVLDACAAPGGKTAHLLELADLEMWALDADASRLSRVSENLQRLGLLNDAVHLQCADAANLDDWWDGRPFDLVLADVPCTASGVVRRHPDIRWLRREADLARTAALQRRIVDALWSTVKPGGKLLYVTCSVFPDEGEQQAQQFAQRHPDAQRLTAPGQILPLAEGGQASLNDGFFYALFSRKA